MWNTLIITVGGTIGLFFKSINSSTGIFERIFILFGCFFIPVLIYSIGIINININKLCLKLKDNLEKKQ
jgi:hypothetical protein